jgi:hypothetical protein
MPQNTTKRSIKKLSISIANNEGFQGTEKRNLADFIFGSYLKPNRGGLALVRTQKQKKQVIAIFRTLVVQQVLCNDSE